MAIDGYDSFEEVKKDVEECLKDFCDMFVCDLVVEKADEDIIEKFKKNESDGYEIGVFLEEDDFWKGGWFVAVVVIKGDDGKYVEFTYT